VLVFIYHSLPFEYEYERQDSLSAVFVSCFFSDPSSFIRHMSPSLTKAIDTAGGSGTFDLLEGDLYMILAQLPLWTIVSIGAHQHIQAVEKIISIITDKVKVMMCRLRRFIIKFISVERILGFYPL
jgi:hypothetical protein